MAIALDLVCVRDDQRLYYRALDLAFPLIHADIHSHHGCSHSGVTDCFFVPMLFPNREQAVVDGPEFVLSCVLYV